MDKRITTDQKEIRISIRQAGKAWRYIHDITSTNAGNLNRKALLKYGNRMIGMISTGRKTIDFDFEDFS